MKKYLPLPYQKSEFLQQMMSRMMIIVRGMPQYDHELSAENLKDCVNRYFGMAAKEKLVEIIEDYKKYHESVYADMVLDMVHVSSHDSVKDQIDFAAIDWIMNTMNVFIEECFFGQPLGQITTGNATSGGMRQLKIKKKLY